MPTAFITGANRGLGLEFVKQLSARGDTVYAACRKPDDADDLNALAGDKVRVVKLDVDDPATVHSAADAVEGELDLLINNAGIFGPETAEQSLSGFDADEAMKVYRTNVAGPLLVTRALADKMASPSKAVSISSGYGSIANAGDWPLFYCCSKAALNMAGKILADVLRSRNITVASLSPGWVQTDMGGQNATLTPEESIRGMLQVIDGLKPEDSGRFLNHKGDELPY